MKKRLFVAEGTLRYPDHWLNPDDLLHFVEFVDDWESLGLDVDFDLFALQISIMGDPEGPPVVKGTGGLRKARFAPPHESKEGARDERTKGEASRRSAQEVR